VLHFFLFLLLFLYFPLAVSGHGGARAAEYVKQNLFSNLIKHPKFISDTKSAIGLYFLCSCFELFNQFTSYLFWILLSTADAYSHTDSEFLKSENNQNRDAGSTASTAILVGDRLLVVNVGDSRAVICRGGNGNINIQKAFYLFCYSFYLFCYSFFSGLLLRNCC